MRNRYKTCGEYTIIYLDRKNNEPMETIIDTEDLVKLVDFNYKFCASKFRTQDDYYALATIHLGVINGKVKNKTLRLHRLIMNVIDDETVVVDHINYNTLDNRKENLRLISIKQNVRSRGRLNSNNITGVRNVCFIDNKYIVQLQENGKNKCFGRFDTLDEATKVAEAKRKELYKEFAGR